MSNIATRDELRNEVNEYVRFFDKGVIDYLNSLIGLEISLFDESGIDEDVFKLIGKLDVYKKIIMYNTYHRALNLFGSEASNFDMSIDGNRSRMGVLKVDCFSKNKTKFPLFEYYFDEVSRGIKLYKDSILDDLERDRLILFIEDIKNNPNKYKNVSFSKRLVHNGVILGADIYGGRVSVDDFNDWFLSDVISEIDPYIVETQKYFNDKFMKENNLDLSDFKLRSVSLEKSFRGKNSCLSKVLTKKTVAGVIKQKEKYYKFNK